MDLCQLPPPFREKARSKEKWPGLCHPTHGQPWHRAGEGCLPAEPSPHPLPSPEPARVALNRAAWDRPGLDGLGTRPVIAQATDGSCLPAGQHHCRGGPPGLGGAGPRLPTMSSGCSSWDSPGGYGASSVCFSEWGAQPSTPLAVPVSHVFAVTGHLVLAGQQQQYFQSKSSLWTFALGSYISM